MSPEEELLRAIFEEPKPLPRPVIARKKPIQVLAVRWIGTNLDEVQAFVGVMENMDGDVHQVRFLPPEARDDEGERIFNDGRAHLWVEANHKWLPLVVGEWVIKEPTNYTGYFYPCKADIFEQTYDINRLCTDGLHSFSFHGPCMQCGEPFPEPQTSDSGAS